MQFTLATIAAVAGLAAAVPHGHQQFHKKDLFSDVTGFLGSIGALAGKNSKTNNGAAWHGNDGQVVNTVCNKGKDPLTFVVWGKDGSWINKIAPLITHQLQPGENLTISHAMGDGYTPNTGGFAALYPGDGLVNGQVAQTWGEYSFTKDMYSSSTYDVSMEPNMNGHKMSITGPKCKADMEHCVFQCKDKSAKSCWEAGSYELIDCQAGSQEGASSGTFNGQQEGGCQGIDNNGVTQLVTELY